METVFARLAPLEARLAALDPTVALDRFAERLEAVQGRVAAIETAENPFAEISEQLTRLYAQKDATVETVFARLAPLEARLAALDPTAALDRFAERLEAVQGRVATLEATENPFAELSEQLDPALRPEGRDGGDGLRPAGTARGEARRARPDGGARPLRRAAGGGAGPGGDASKAAENPFAEISEQLTRLYAQKDATVETVFARLAPLEARLAALDPTSGARPLRRAAGGGAGPGGGARRRREPVRGDLRAADPALRAEGCDGGDGVRAPGAHGGAARRARAGARPAGAARRGRSARGARRAEGCGSRRCTGRRARPRPGSPRSGPPPRRATARTARSPGSPTG